MLSARSILLCLLTCAVAVLTGCGGGGQRAAVTETIVASASTDDPADCERLHTMRFLERTYGVRGEEAVASCEADAVSPEVEDAKSVTVTGIEVDGERARADAAFVGSRLDGQKVTLGLVEEDGRWKIDELIGFVHFDRERILEALTEQSVDLAEEIGEPAFPACVLAWFEARDDEELEAFLIAPEASDALRAFEDCARRAGADQSA